jgi:hypothetical protein
MLWKNLLGSYYHFLPTLKPTGHKTVQKIEKSFFQTWIRINYIFQFWFRTNKVLKLFHPSVYIVVRRCECEVTVYICCELAWENLYTQSKELGPMQQKSHVKINTKLLFCPGCGLERGGGMLYCTGTVRISTVLVPPHMYSWNFNSHREGGRGGELTREKVRGQCFTKPVENTVPTRLTVSPFSSL